MNDLSIFCMLIVIKSWKQNPDTDTTASHMKHNFKSCNLVFLSFLKNQKYFLFNCLLQDWLWFPRTLQISDKYSK